MWYRVGLVCAAAISIASVACGGAVDPTATGDGNVATYSAMLTCGDGEAVLEVDRADARNAKLIVAGEEASRHIREAVARVANDRGEIILAGQTRLPVDDPNSFDRFVDDSGRFDRAPGGATLAPATLGGADTPAHIVAEVRRSAVDKIYLSFQEVNVTRKCSGTIDGHYCRGGEWTEERAIRELASWSFSGCR